MKEKHIYISSLNNNPQCSYTGWRKAWIMFDKSNGIPSKWGCSNGQGFMWSFRNRKEAREWKRYMKRTFKDTKLTQPMLVEM